MSPEIQPTVLLVDKPAALESLGVLLNKEYQVRTAADAESAMAALEEGPVQIVVADSHVTGGGLELLEAIRKARPDTVRILLVKDDADFKAASVPLQQGAIQRTLLKPVRPSDFKAAVRTAAELHRLREERRTLRQQLDKSARLRLQGLALMARELRTPVTFVQGLLELMSADPDPGKLPDRLAKLQERVGRLSATVENVVRLLDAEEAPGLPARTPVSVGELLAEAAEGLAPPAEALRRTITLDVDADLPAVPAVKPVLADALGQLLHAAVAVSGEGGRIKVTATALDGQVVIDVSDAGEMIPEADAPEVFEPFYFSRTPRPNPDVPGPALPVGLASVKRAVELHGGRIELKDTSPTGNTFRVHLPTK